MSRPLRNPVSLAVAAALAACSACAPSALAATPTIAPLPSSDYATRPACAPPAPEQASCLAVQLLAVTAEARRHRRPIGAARPTSIHPTTGAPASGDYGYRPQDLHNAYSLPDTSEAPQTIALVDAYNDPTAATDLAAYEHEFGLDACTESDCFEQLNQNGESGESKMPFPRSLAALKAAEASSEEASKAEAEAAIGWGAEISLDIETARAVCQNCRILLIEADSDEYENLEKAEATASRLGATEISNSWGGPEEGITPAANNAGPFNRPGTVITASTGDDGFLGWQAENSFEKGYPEYPASSPHVIAVGGTHLLVGAEGQWAGETVWNGYGATGGGCSAVFDAPSWQSAVSDWSQVGCGDKRASADVSADGDPYTGVAVTDSDDPGEACEGEYEGRHWCTYGGTSLASPLVASVFALAGGAHGVEYPAQTLYESRAHAPGTLHDVTSGSNGYCSKGYDKEGVSLCKPSSEAAASCSSSLVCLAGPGYDGPSGVGTPDGILGFEPGHYEVGESGGEREETKVLPPPSTPPAAEAPIAQSAAPIAIEISELALTVSATRAMKSRHPSASKISFTFRLNAFSRIRISLTRQQRAHGRSRWVAVSASSAVPFAPGLSSRHLNGGRLAPGLYRLTLTPVGGPARSIEFRVA